MRINRRISQQNLFTLSSIQLRNFKAIKSSGFSVKPLTVLLGANATGKSTFIQSVLLLAQNFARQDNSFDLQLNGAAVRLGTFGEVIRRGSKGGFSIELGLKPEDATALGWRSYSPRLTVVCNSPSPASGVALISEVTLEARVSPTDSFETIATRLGAKAQPSDSNSSFARIKTVQTTEHTTLERQDVDYAIYRDDRLFEILPYTKSQYLRSENVLKWLIRSVLATNSLKIRRSFDSSEEFNLNKEVAEIAKVVSTPEVEESRWTGSDEPEELKLAVDALAYLTEQIKAIIETNSNSSPLTRGELVTEFVDEQIEELSYLLNKIKFEDYKMAFIHLLRRDSKGWTLLKLPLGLRMADRMLPAPPLAQEYRRFLSKNVQYLGPLRAEPGTVQPLDIASSSIAPLGIKGEYMAYHLTSGPLAKQKFEYPLPNGVDSLKVTLKEALEIWLSALGLGKKVEISPVGQFGLTVLIDEIPIFATGTGLSQVLPVILICLMAKPFSTTLIEQPELHLHPATQRKLADFFIEIVKTNRFVIVETHSEYMLNRLRRAIALQLEDSELVKIVFTESKAIDGEIQTVYREATIKESGELTSWPDGFFDFSDEDNLEIMLANFEREGSS